MSEYTVGSLFTGIGGIDLAVEAAGFRIAWQVEIDDFCTDILSKRWPDVPRFRDVRECGAYNLARCDVLVGGFPCTDISVAGKGEGIRPGTRSGLWFEFARIIGELRPRLVLLENVPAITSRDGTVVLDNLATLGYDARWGVISAADAGAAHRRERWFCMAYADGAGLAQREGEPEDAEAQCAPAERTGNGAGRRGAKSRLGRSPDGIPAWLDESWHRLYVARPGQPQHGWEPPRAASGQPHRTSRLKALGNAVVPAVVYPIAVMMRLWLEGEGNG